MDPRLSHRQEASDERDRAEQPGAGMGEKRTDDVPQRLCDQTVRVRSAPPPHPTRQSAHCSIRIRRRLKKSERA